MHHTLVFTHLDNPLGAQSGSRKVNMGKFGNRVAGVLIKTSPRIISPVNMGPTTAAGR